MANEMGSGSQEWEEENVEVFDVIYQLPTMNIIFLCHYHEINNDNNINENEMGKEIWSWLKVMGEEMRESQKNQNIKCICLLLKMNWMIHFKHIPNT